MLGCGMANKDAFNRDWKRLQLMLVGAVIVCLAVLAFSAVVAASLWVGFVALIAVLIWRLRCWNCGERLLKDGAGHIEWRGSSVLKWKPARHKSCGAELS